MRHRPCRRRPPGRLRRTARRHQREGRVPGLVAAVCRGGELLWTDGIGVADVADGPASRRRTTSSWSPPTPRPSPPCSSCSCATKGGSALDDLLGDHLPEVTHAVTVRQALAHVSGMQREPMGDVWDTLVQPDGEELRSGFNEAERVGRPHDHWHYSNLAYAMLGQLVEAVDGRAWAEAVRARSCVPLGADPHDRRLRWRAARDGLLRARPSTTCHVPSRCSEFRAMNPAAGWPAPPPTWPGGPPSWLTPTPRCSRPTRSRRCASPRCSPTPRAWTAAVGLGLLPASARPPDRTYVGHDGGIPGHVTSRVHPPRERHRRHRADEQHAAPDPATIAIGLADHVVEHDPVEEEPWQPAADVPEEIVGMLGRWLTEGRPMTITLRAGRLEARMDGLPGRPGAIGLRSGSGLRLPHRLGTGARRAAARHPGTRRLGVAPALGDVPVHEGAAGVRRAPRRLSLRR